MLGIKTNRNPISGDAAQDIRQAIQRISTGNLNNQEKEMVAHTKAVLNKFNVRWIGLDGKEI